MHNRAFANPVSMQHQPQERYVSKKALTCRTTAKRPITVVFADGGFLVREAVAHMLAEADGVELMAVPTSTPA